MTKIDLVRDYAIRDVLDDLNGEFKQISEMDKMLGLAKEDPLKSALKEILPESVEEFVNAIDQKGVNTTTEASIKDITKNYLKSLIKNIINDYKKENSAQLKSLIGFVQPYAIKIVIACETGEEKKSASELKNMLTQCVDRFCAQYKAEK